MNIELEVYEHSGQVLAAFLICIVLLRIICSKAKHLDDATADKEILNKVGYKIEELELKVNILTYKMQYGSWPLPHQVHKSKFRKNLRNLRLTLSNPNERNEWIKHILLSPRRNESYSKYSYASKQRLTELFVAKKNNCYPYLQRDNLSLEYSSRSSKSSSDKSARLNFIFRKTIGRRQHKLSKNEYLDLEKRNAISLPHFSRRRNSRFTCKRNKDKAYGDEREACKRFLKTMADCKRYLKELHDSNKHLGLVCSSSEVSDGLSAKTAWSETQGGKDDEQRPPDNLSENFEGKEPDEPAKEANTDNETSVKETDSKQENEENRSELSSAICPVLKVSDKHLLSSKMNITFCADMFPRQSVSNMLIQSACERKKFMQSSEEALYQVKKKLESLHNVLRTYELRNSEARVTEGPQESNNKINNICQNVMDTLVSTASEINNCNEKKKSRVSFDAVRREESDEMQQTVYNSSEQYDTDDTGRSSELSVQKYSSTFTTHYLNNELHCAQPKNHENKIYFLSNQDLNVVNDNETRSTIICNKIPERVYYTISSGLFENKDINRAATAVDNSIKSNIYTESNQVKLFSGRQAVPMETDEDLLVVSPTSSRTEISKDSESDDKSTALLLQEALQFKRALLTRIELEKICHTDESSENMNSQSISEYDKYSYINNNLQSKLLDIISEEQSVSSSTEKTSRTYMYFNTKQDKQLAHSSTFNNNMVISAQQSEIKDMPKGYLDSKDNLTSTSEYFSFSNIIQERSSTNSNQLPSSKHRCLQENDSAKMVQNNLQMKNLSTTGNSDEKHVEMRLTNYLKNVDTNMNQQETSYEYVNEREYFDKRFPRISNVNELINPDTESVELFSQNLDETLDEEQNANMNEMSNFLNSECLTECTNVSYSKHKEGPSLDATLNLLDDGKYAEDNEMLMFSPNLTLKRHPGTCSLIEQTLIATSTEKTMEMRTLIESADMYELSASESKENSIETNLIQDSLTSSINHSNDSNIPEPPSVTVLTNKLADEEELDLNWSYVKNDFSDDCINEKKTQTFSTDTITLRKYESVDTENYCRQETTCNEDTTLTKEYETVNIHCEEEGKSENVHSIMESSFTNLGNEESVNETVYKSYSNLISPHSSLYFTDEASSSIAKLNNAHSKNFEDYLQPNLRTEKNNDQLYYQEADPKDTELASSSMSNENKNIVTTTVINAQKSCIKVSDNQFDTEQELSNSNKRVNNKSDPASKKGVENTDEFLINEIKEALKKNEALNKASDSNNNSCNLLPSININNSHKTQSNLLICKTESLNVNQSMSNTSRQNSPRSMKENTIMRRMNTTLKSRSQENTPKAEKVTKSSAAQNVKELKSDSFNTIQTKRESSAISTHTKVRNLSVEPRRSTEHNIKLEKKRSRSQISFRSNESSKRVTSQSCEFPNNRDSQSSESKLKSKSLVKALLPTPRTSSKSCIPILKSRLEAARRSENEGRPKSPVRGPLTMTMFWRDNLSNNSPNVMEETIKVEGNSETNNQSMGENSYAKRNDDQKHTDKDELMKSSCIVRSLCENTNSNIIPQEPMVIYVNIFTKYDHNATKIVDPKKFLEYIKNRKLNVQKVIEENQSNLKEDTSVISTEKEKNTMHKIVTIVSSIMNGNELRGTAVDLSASKTNSGSIINTLSSDKLKQLCFLSVEQREIDVTAKPSVIDTSTSISDLENISGTSQSVLSKFQICGTPKELNNDEYITLLEILHQEANFAHLQELQNVCSKLVSEHQKSK